MRSCQCIVIGIVCAMLTIAGCTNRNDAMDETKENAAWQQYNEARKAKDLKRTLAVIASMEQTKIVSTPKANHLRGLAYDQGWQMRIAEHFYKKAYQGFASKPIQDWNSYTDAGYRWACLRFGRGDTEGALSVITELLPQAKDNKAFPKRTEASILMLMADCQIITSPRYRKITSLVFYRCRRLRRQVVEYAVDTFDFSKDPVADLL